MPTPPAADHGMLLLASLSLGLPVRTDGGALAVLVEPAGMQPVPAETLDWLEERGYLDLSSAEPRVTDRGEWMLAKWARTHFRKRLTT